MPTQTTPTNPTGSASTAIAELEERIAVLEVTLLDLLSKLDNPA